jgi:hypothetical protein
MRIKEQETRLTLHEHNDDDHYDNGELFNFNWLNSPLQYTKESRAQINLSVNLY